MDQGQVGAQLEAPAERRVDAQGAVVGVPTVVRPAEGADREAVEDAVGGVEPALARGTAASRHGTRPGLVPALAEKSGQGERTPLRGLRVDVAEDRLLGGSEQAQVLGLPTVLLGAAWDRRCEHGAQGKG